MKSSPDPPTKHLFTTGEHLPAADQGGTGSEAPSARHQVRVRVGLAGVMAHGPGGEGRAQSCGCGGQWRGLSRRGAVSGPGRCRLMGSVPRRGVRHVHVEAPVCVWEHAHPPRACRPHPEHLVEAAGDRAAGEVRGEDPGAPLLSSPGPGRPWYAVRVGPRGPDHGLTGTEPRTAPCHPHSGSGAARLPWTRSRRCIQSSTRCSTGPARSTGRSWTARSCSVRLAPGLMDTAAAGPEGG